MALPETIETPVGFTVAGAGPELLAELLERLARECLRGGFDLDQTFNPGASRQEIVDAWAPFSITPPEEAVVCWMWHDGYRMNIGGHQYPGADLLPLDQSTGMYAVREKGDGEYSWNPAWIPLWAPSMSIAMDTTPTSGAPLVRRTDRGLGTFPPETDWQVVSMCTPLTWWLTSFDNGWTVWTSNGPETDWAAIPEPWRRTQLALY